jgi:2,5-dihydroxypyridine 5,6-dioxygenase
MDSAMTVEQASGRLDETWIAAFARVFELCQVNAGQQVIILSETHSRAVHRQLAELALARLGARYWHLQVPSRPPPPGPLVRSTGAADALTEQTQAVAALASCDLVVDLTVEGLMHAPQTAEILRGGARILNVSNEHPEVLARLLPQPEMKARVKEAVARCRAAREMRVTSAAGTDLRVTLDDAPVAGVWGWTDRPGTLAHWPGGVVVCFPRQSAVNGTLVMQPGDINLGFKRYLDSTVTCTVVEDYITRIDGEGADARLMRQYLAAFDADAYATSHVGWGLNPAARYEALTLYSRDDSNGTELRALAGNFLYSTGANEFAGRYTRGHFDLPMLGCTITVDKQVVVDDGLLLAS